MKWLRKYCFRDQNFLWRMNCDHSYVDLDGNGVCVYFEKLPILKATLYGYWVDIGSASKRKKRFVNMYATKKFGHETRAGAVESFLARKDRQLEHLYRQTKMVEDSVKRAEAGIIDRNPWAECRYPWENDDSTW